MMNERRTAPRKALDDTVVARTRTTTTVRVLDISLGGMRVQSEEPLAPHKELVVWLPTRHGEIRLRANVLRCRARFLKLPLTSGAVLVYDAGLQFSEMSARERRLIEESFFDESGKSIGNETNALLALTEAINETVKTA
ncbi:MAG: PilZ domain-containing protein [Acidobacteria bacterium]|nr:PilZ domain-containing protein [Acidobacteriota bacterium]